MTGTGLPLDVHVYMGGHVPGTMEDDRGTLFVFVMEFQQIRRRIEGEEQDERYMYLRNPTEGTARDILPVSPKFTSRSYE